MCPEMGRRESEMMDEEEDEAMPIGWKKAEAEFEEGVNDFHRAIERIVASLVSLRDEPMSMDMHEAVEMRFKRWGRVGENVNPLQDDFYCLKNELRREAERRLAREGE